MLLRFPSHISFPFPTVFIRIKCLFLCLGSNNDVVIVKNFTKQKEMVRDNVEYYIDDTFLSCI